MSNLLDKASIILTPTAYNNGEALCVKPSDGSGDFDFSRNSAATRVNAQGLVENVQILSSNLVQNGDFSEEGVEEVSNGSFSQEGAELVTNGDFATDSDWFKSGQVTIGGGVAYFDSDGTFTQIAQNLSGISGKSAKVVIEITEYNQGTLKVLFSGGAQQNLPTSVGTHTLYFSNVASNTLNIARVGGVTNIKIDNVSVREVGQDWELQNGWSIGDDVAVFSGTASAYRKLYQENILTIGETYKLTFDIVSINSGSIKNFSQSNPTSYSTIGTKTEYFTATFDDLFLEPTTDADCSITNISVKEVGQNWEFNSTAILTANGMNITTGGYIRQDVVTIGKSYKLTYDIVSYTSGNIRVYDGTSQGSIPTSVGSNTFNFTAGGSVFVIQSNSANVNLVITNISVIEITDDTNLPRINYEGFSYQDALGSELITNLDFEDGWGASNATIDNFNSFTTTTSFGYIRLNNILTIGKTYVLKIQGTTTSTGTNAFNIRRYNGSFLYKTGITGTFNETFTFTALDAGIMLSNEGLTTTVINNISIKEYLGQEVVPDSGCGSWLFEPQSTNTINNSNSNFIAVNMDLVYNDVKSPDGTQNAFKATTTTTGGSQFRPNQTQITPSTFSIFLKYGNNQWYQVINSSATGFYANIDVQNGVFGTSGADTDNLSVKDYGNGWFRFSGTFTSASTTGSIRVYASSSSSAGWAGVSAPIGSYVYGYGFQVEALDYATSYIPTEGTQKTRNQDVCTNGGGLASINSTEGVIYWEGAKLQEASGTQVLGLSDGSGANRIGFQTSPNVNQIRFVVDAGGNQASKFFVLDDITDFNKYALKWKQDDFSFWVNGIKIGTDTSGNVPALNALNTLDFYYGTGNGTGIYNFTAKTKALAVWKEALSDEELTELTTI